MSGDEGTAGDEGYGMSGDGGKAKRRVAAAMVLGAMETRRTRMFVMAGGSFLIALACLNMLASFKKTRTTLLKSKVPSPSLPTFSSCPLFFGTCQADVPFLSVCFRSPQLPVLLVSQSVTCPSSAFRWIPTSARRLPGVT
eukprot:438650-Hanusia_phi.AAC.1